MFQSAMRAIRYDAGVCYVDTYYYWKFQSAMRAIRYDATIKDPKEAEHIVSIRYACNKI